METLQYKVIKTKPQYNRYCTILEGLTAEKKRSRAVEDEIELLTLLIEKWDATHTALQDADPVAMLAYLMKDHQMKAVDLARLLQVSEGLVSDILHYRKGFSKEVIRKLSGRFKVSQEAFNRPYSLRAVKIPPSKTRV